MSDAINDPKINDATTVSPSETTPALSQGEQAKNIGQIEDVAGLKASQQKILAEKKAGQLKIDELTAKLAEFETAKETADRNALEEKGEYKKLFEETQKTSDINKKTSSDALLAIGKIFESELTSLPSEQKDKFEKLFGDVMDPVKKLEKLSIFKSEMPTIQNPAVAPSQANNDLEELRKNATSGSPTERAAALKYFKQNPDKLFA